MSRKSREIRLGLVLYGGVSLAIYINGVTREFHRAVRGEGIYRVIKALVDSDITVDVISGTSAGGINGILLAHSLVNAEDFALTASLWREHGDIGDLIHDPKHCAQANSILDGEGYFQPKLRDAFRLLGSGPGATSGPLDDPSPTPELDLFITGTDVHGDVYTWFDELGHSVDVKDHQVVFRLKHRAPQAAVGGTPRYTDFTTDADTDLALAKLARVTSCFPAAFPPVKVAKAPVPDSTQAGQEERADAKLRTWGQLAGDRDYFFLDGGVLDNKPFSSTTRQIFFRHADRPVQRWLFYVEPDPESFVPPSERMLTAPGVASAAMVSLLAIPSYESIGGDLREIAERNAEIERFDILCSGLDAAETPTPLVQALGALEARDRESASAGQEARPSRTRERTGRLDGNLYVRARLLALAQRAILGVLRRNGRDRLITSAAERSAAAHLVRGFFEHRDADALDTLHDFDVYFRLRRLFNLLYLPIWDDALKAAPASDGPDPVRDLHHAVSSQVDLLQVVLSVMERTVDAAELRFAPDGARAPEEVWTLLEAVLFCLLYPVLDTPLVGGTQAPQIAPTLPSVPDSAFLTTLLQTLRARSEVLIRITGEVPRSTDGAAQRRELFLRVFTAALPPERRPMTLLRAQDRSVWDLLSEETAGAAGLTRTLAESYTRFGSLDEVMFPLQKDPFVFERDVIRVVRLSPKDAVLGLSQVNDYRDKVAGDVLGHFGAFFKRSWRSNDILWGRLDGLSQLAETLLEPERVRAVLVARGDRPTLSELVGVDLAGLFPGADAQRLARLESDFAAVAGDAQTNSKSDSPAHQARFAASWTPFLKALIEAGQNEILADDLPTVIRDAALQATIWNNFPVDSNVDAKADRVGIEAERLVFRQGDRPLDPTLAGLLAESACAAKLLGPSSEPSLDRVAFFKDHYRVGAESVGGHIPAEVLARTATKALAVAYRAVLNGLPDDVRPRFERLGPVKVLGRTITLGHGLSGLFATSRQSRRTLFIAVWVLALIALGLMLGVATGALKPGEGVQGLFWLIVAAPVVTLALWTEFKSRGIGAAIRWVLGLGVLALALWKAVEVLAGW